MHLDTAPFHEVKNAFGGANFRFPTYLQTEAFKPARICLIGSCLLGALQNVVQSEFDFVLHHGGMLPAIDPARYDFIVLQVPLRVIIRDTDLLDIPYGNLTAFEERMVVFRERLQAYLRTCFGIAPENQVPVFVLNFLVPTRNPNGALQPKYAINNVQRMIGQLNEEMEAICLQSVNKHVIDLDDIANTFGKRYFSDEFTGWYSHGGLFPFFNEGMNGSRMEPSPHTVEHFELLDQSLLMQATYNEILGHMQILCGTGQIKLVVIDLDDTLWNGVAGELAISLEDGSEITDVGRYSDLIEGWPMGFIEGLKYFKKRGGLIGVISRNSEAFIRKVFPLIFRGEMTMSDFAAVKINQGVKADNMQLMLQELNLLPANVLYIDDNPVERSRMDASFPDIRITGRYFQYLRSMLMGAPELQVARISTESATRTEMVQRQLQRHQEQAVSDPQEFLQSLGLKLRFYQVAGSSSSGLKLRAIELINKTNQWNSTGARLDEASLEQFLSAGGLLYGASANDRYTHYGDVLFALVRSGEIVQMVMSCRVAGLGMESAFLQRILSALGWTDTSLRFTDTGRNAPFKFFVTRFAEGDGDHRVSSASLDACAHIADADTA
jgi:FkbH-like protein